MNNVKVGENIYVFTLWPTEVEKGIRSFLGTIVAADPFSNRMKVMYGGRFHKMTMEEGVVFSSQVWYSRIFLDNEETQLRKKAAKALAEVEKEEIRKLESRLRKHEERLEIINKEV